MLGEWTPVWRDTWREVWSRLARSPSAPEDMFVELFGALPDHLSETPSAQELAYAVDTPVRARVSFRRVKSSSFRDEVALTAFLEEVFEVVEDLGGDDLSNRYFILIQSLISKFSLRYDLRRPFSLHPTLAGVFSSMMREIKAVAAVDAGLQPVLHDFEESLRDLTADKSELRIKTCIQKQVNLLEALGQKHPATASNTLGQMCNEVGTWPHEKVKDAVRDLYKFASGTRAL